MNFASDNTAGMAPEILDAMAKANTGYALGYGNDDWTKRVEQRFAEIFEKRGRGLSGADRHGRECARARASVAALGRGAVPCRVARRDRRMRRAGILRRRHQADRPAGRGSQDLRRDLARARSTAAQWGGPHHVSPSVLSLSQATECGTIYRVAEVRELAEIAHEHGVAVHMDGARIGNALVRMNVSPAEATWKAGVDVLSFGATKGGAMGAEAVIFFDPQARRRTCRTGASAAARSPPSTASSRRRWRPIWRTICGCRLARHANAMADALAAGLTAAGCKPVWPVEANEVFAPITAEIDKRLKAAGAMYYPWPRATGHRRGQDAGAARHVVPDHAGRRREVSRHRAFITSARRASLRRSAAQAPPDSLTRVNRARWRVYGE